MPSINSVPSLRLNIGCHSSRSEYRQNQIKKLPTIRKLFCFEKR
ncbi:uncharacterized protein Dvar_59960 [Desulfosarcina variabilis str. Montpellier]